MDEYTKKHLPAWVREYAIEDCWEETLSNMLTYLWSLNEEDQSRAIDNGWRYVYDNCMYEVQ